MSISDFFKLHKNVAVAFSGGVDSAVLLLFAKQYADCVKAYYVKSPFQPQFEYEDALKVADFLKVELRVIKVNVLDDADIVKNPENRCYYCKKKIFGSIINAAESDGLKTVLDGTNASDNENDRPGFRALKELGVLSPLRDYKYTKKQIREIANENSLPVANKPSYACLATRIPTHTPVTKQLLEKTEKAENALFNLGFENLRVRYLNGAAKLEIGKNGFRLLNEKRDEVIKLLSPYYSEVYLDLKERTDE